MRGLFVGTSFAALSALVACGGAVGPGETSATGAGAGGGGGGPGVTPGDAAVGGFGGGALLADGGLSDARYVDPGCAPTTKVVGPRDCDPYPAFGTCGLGGRCAPYVKYTDKCQAEEIGTECEVAGSGVQGDDCSSDLDPCADGYQCVSAGSGFVCAKFCVIEGSKDDCPPGLICAPLDVEGFFVCG